MVAVFAVGGVFAVATTVPLSANKAQASWSAPPAALAGVDAAELDRWLASSGTVETARTRLREAGAPWSTWGPRTITGIELRNHQSWASVAIRCREPLLVDVRMNNLELIVLGRVLVRIFERYNEDHPETPCWPSGVLDESMGTGVAGISRYWQPELDAVRERFHLPPSRPSLRATEAPR